MGKRQAYNLRARLKASAKVEAALKVIGTHLRDADINQQRALLDLLQSCLERSLQASEFVPSSTSKPQPPCK